MLLKVMIFLWCGKICLFDGLLLNIDLHSLFLTHYARAHMPEHMPCDLCQWGTVVSLDFLDNTLFAKSKNLLVYSAYCSEGVGILSQKAHNKYPGSKRPDEVTDTESSIQSSTM